MSYYRYHNYGITFASALECPELSPTSQAAEVTIQVGPVPTTLAAPLRKALFYEIDADQCLLKLETVAGARYLVRHGHEMIVERCAGAHDDAVRSFLLGLTLSALFYQRNLLPIHGSAINTAQGAVIFMGPSGSGKSTLAAAFHNRGYAPLADDISVIRFNAAGVPYLAPGCPQLKLWADSAQMLKQPLRQLDSATPTLQKYRFPTAMIPHTPPPPIYALYQLQPSTRVTTPIIEARQGMAKLAPIQMNAYRRQLAIAMGKQPFLFTQAAALARHSQVRVIQRPVGSFMLDELVALLEADWHSGPESTG